MGITLYIFLCEIIPFYGKSTLECDIKSKDEELIFDPKFFSDDAIDLIKNMCQKE